MNRIQTTRKRAADDRGDAPAVATWTRFDAASCIEA